MKDYNPDTIDALYCEVNVDCEEGLIKIEEL